MNKERKRSLDDSLDDIKCLTKLVDDGKISDEQLLLDACIFPLVISDLNGKILAVNDSFAKIFKKSRQDLIGTSGYPQVELEAGERRRQTIFKMIREKKAQYLEDYERGIWWRSIFQPVYNESGEVEKFAVFIENISNKKNFEQQITEKNEEFWKRLIQYSNNSFFIVNENGDIRYVSESVKPIMGYSPREMIGKNILDFFYEPDKKKGLDLFENLDLKKKIQSLSHRIVSKKDEIKYIETTVNNLLDNPSVKGVIITSRDITNARKTEIENIETKKFLENVINSTSEIIFSVNRDERIVLWNERIAHISGYSSAYVIGKKLRSLSFVDNIDSFKSYLLKCLKSQSKPYDLKIRTKDGDSRLFRIQGSPFKKDEQNNEGVVFTGRDITSDAKIHGHLVTGASYLILDETNSKAIDLLNGLLLKDFSGLFITRENTNRFVESSDINLPVSIYNYNQEIKINGKRKSISSDPSTLIDIISSFFSEHQHSIILLDRLDYLIALHGFVKVMQLIYSLSNVAFKIDGIILIRLNPEILSTKELAILREELNDLPEQSVGNVTIDNKLFDILRYVEQENSKKSMVSFKNIGKQFSITKVTTAKRINALEDKELLAIKKRGRLKTIFITDKGKQLLQRRNVV